MLFYIARYFQWLQNLYIRLQVAGSPAICHNIGKIEIIKKAFHQVTTEHVEGGYFEFGVFEGSSLLAAVKTYQSISSGSAKKFYAKSFMRNFYGFDSFDEGFKYLDEKDKHPFFEEGAFVSSYEKCLSRFKNSSNVKLIKGYFEDVMKDQTPKALFSDEKCAIMFIDCDLTNPAYTVLQFMKDILQPGSIIILDDYFAYKGDPLRGTAGAFKRFLDENPGFKTREFFSYGYNGRAFIVYETPTQARAHSI